MPDIITLIGFVASEPRAITTSEGLAITSFRLASSQRRYDKVQQKWVDGDTNWYTITGFRQLATNVAVSVKRGERVLVTGRLRIRAWEAGDRNGTNVEVDAEAVGHDLSWGTANFSRSIVSTAVDQSDGAAGGGVAGSSAAGGSAAADSFPSEAELEGAGIGAGISAGEAADPAPEGSGADPEPPF